MSNVTTEPTLADITAALEADGYLVLPAFAEPHAHLDKAFLAERIPNPTGDLMGAIMGMRAHRGSITVADTAARAERAARLMAANGTTAIRTHADVTTDNGLMSVEALVAVRDRLRDLVDIQIVGLAGYPSIGADGDGTRNLLREAIAMGIDVVGGCPHFESNPAEANDLFLTIAAEAGLPVDLHTDETLDPAICGLADLAERVIATGFPYPVSASHCCSLGVQPEARQRVVAERVAAAGIHVIALPQTNLFLQGRQHGQSTPRGITAVRALLDAGVHVAAGADNLQDPFNPVGRGDALETASLMVTAAHLLPEEAMAAVSTEARHVLGIPGAGDLVGIRAASVREAIAFGPADRVVVRRGVVRRGVAVAGGPSAG